MLVRVTIYAAASAFLASSLYAVLIGTLTVNVVLSEGVKKGKPAKRVKGFWKRRGALRKLKELEAKGRYPTDYEFLQGNHFDLDRVWSPGSRAVAKQCIALPFVFFNVGISTALSSGEILVLLKR